MRSRPAATAAAPLVRAVAGLLTCLVLALAGCSGAPVRTAGPSGSPAAASPSWAAGMPTVPVSALPAEARRTLRLIDAGGPFPYARDGVVFGDYEGLLPRRPRGYYREYTVPTPGVRGRGARRIITGAGHETYYTDDHYRSFRAVIGR